MKDLDRRTLLQMIGAGSLSGVLPPSIERALAVQPERRTGTIADVDHIVILMQENRSFDHLFGTLRGVRGFNDPRAVRLPSGKPVWQQPSATGDVLPFRPNVASLGLTFLPDPPHGWNDTHAAWNGGRHDQWVPNKGLSAMTYHLRKDAPYHYALADAFTLCDAYHCSLLGPTDPNRYHMWTGWVGNDGQGGGPVISNAELGYDWSTFPERLERAGIDWKIYQDVGVGLTADGYWGWTSDPYVGNYGDNSLLYFHQYQNAPAGTPLAARARTGTEIASLDRDPTRLFDILRDDVRKGRLPAVSWIVAPEAYSEHPNHPTDFGAWYTSQVIDILAANAEVFARTVLFITYDEEGGFFDHMVPPTPPLTGLGKSTVSTVNELFAGNGAVVGPYGLGMRVPMIVVSPWSKGGWVNSQLFDHTSLIRFIEARYAREVRGGLREDNITAWRRAVVGDLTSTLEFRKPERERTRLPDTSKFLPPDLERHPDEKLNVPSVQRLPEQERGVRPARALPYELHARGQADSSGRRFVIEFGNSGDAAAVFQVRSGQPEDAPRTYTVEPRQSLFDSWSVSGTGYDLTVHGPNGFLRAFKGRMARDATDLLVRASYDPGRLAITLQITNRGTRKVDLEIRDGYRGRSADMKLRPNESDAKSWSLTSSRGWYELSVSADGDPSFGVVFAGHVESGEDSISDPLMGRVRVDD